MTKPLKVINVGQTYFCPLVQENVTVRYETVRVNKNAPRVWAISAPSGELHYAYASDLEELPNDAA